MNKLLTEKFEVDFPPPAETNDWASDKSARRAKFDDRQRVGPGNLTGRVLNALPPGSDICGQALADVRSPTRTMSGETDASHDFNREAVANGYKRLPMRPTDDQYSGEHRDTFYSEETVDGNTGFIERGNVLDRQ